VAFSEFNIHKTIFDETNDPFIFLQTFVNYGEDMLKSHILKPLAFITAIALFGCSSHVALDLSSLDKPVMLGKYVGPNKLELPTSAKPVETSVSGVSINGVVSRATGAHEITTTTTTGNTLISKLSNIMDTLSNPCAINTKIGGSRIRLVPLTFNWTNESVDYVWYDATIYDLKSSNTTPTPTPIVNATTTSISDSTSESSPSTTSIGGN